VIIDNSDGIGGGTQLTNNNEWADLLKTRRKDVRPSTVHTVIFVVEPECDIDEFKHRKGEHME